MALIGGFGFNSFLIFLRLLRSKGLCSRSFSIFFGVLRCCFFFNSGAAVFRAQVHFVTILLLRVLYIFIVYSSICLYSRVWSILEAS